MRKTITAAAVLVLVAVAAAAATWWITGRDGEIRADGTCATGLYELSAEREDGGLEVTFELQSSAPDESWQVRLEQDGEVLLQGERRTDSDGELEVDLTLPDGEGSVFAVEATGPDGQVCAAELTA
jgi:hypothetical protein